MSKIPPCVGVIVFDKDRTILVCTDHGNYSFPKGKRNKGETDLQTGLRELEEETGLTKDHIELIDDFTLDEMSRKGNLSVRYFVAKLVKEHKKITFDKSELEAVEWIDVTKAYKLEKFVDRRKEILQKAYDASIK